MPHPLRRLSAMACLIMLTAALSLATPTSQAAGDLTRQEAVEVHVQLGNTQGELRFTPHELEFETGKLYKLVLSNPSQAAHYFTSPTLAGAVYTRKVQINDGQGKPLAEIKGQVNELEVHPGGRIEWWFVPVKTARGELGCSIAGHTEHGMRGTVSIR